MPRSKKGPLLLVDADVLAYQAVHAAGGTIDWGDDVVSDMGDLGAAKDFIDKSFDDLMGTLFASSFRPALSDRKHNWRKDVLPTYKHNRTPKPPMLGPVRKYIVAKHGGVIVPSLEGDDVLGIWATLPKYRSAIIVSIDKDLKTIPARIYNPGRDEIVTVTPEEADRFHLTQTLTGDQVDGYKGCPGIGPVKAAEILAGGLDWSAVVAAYEAKGLTEEDALVQARVARILRADEYDFAKREPVLWTPSLLG